MMEDHSRSRLLKPNSRFTTNMKAWPGGEHRTSNSTTRAILQKALKTRRFSSLLTSSIWWIFRSSWGQIQQRNKFALFPGNQGMMSPWVFELQRSIISFIKPCSQIHAIPGAERFQPLSMKWIISINGIDNSEGEWHLPSFHYGTHYPVLDSY